MPKTRKPAGSIPNFTTRKDHFDWDLGRMNTQLHEMGAVKQLDDGFQYVDESLVPADFMRAYQGLLQCGYAEALL